MSSTSIERVSGRVPPWVAALKFIRLDALKRLTLLQAVCLLPGVALGLRMRGFNRTFSFLENHSPAPRATSAEAKMVQRFHLLLDGFFLATRYGPYKGNCLSRSLVLWWLLRQQGIPGELRIGVRHTSDVIEAHAWVECQGWVLNDQPDVRRRFVPFERPIIPVGATIR